MATSNNSIVLTSDEITEFCEQIALVIKAGISTYEGVSILADHSPSELSDIFKLICERLDCGDSFSEALTETGAFPDYMLHMVNLGEQTGTLEHVMDSLSNYYRREANIKSSIKHAVTYPLVMTILMLVILFILIGKVLPVFKHIYEELGAELTGVSKTMVDLSSNMSTYLIVFLVIVAVIGVFAFFYFRSDSGKAYLNKKSFFMDISRSRFASAMALALSSGFDTDEGLSIAGMLSENAVLRDKITNCQAMIKEGESFLNSILSNEIFDRRSSSMLHVGDKTGSMDKVMKELADEYQNLANSRIDRLISWLEPILVIVLCVVIGFILLAFLVPLLSIMSALG
ncbi:MAG: type II secretion system F family protein [Lachnospiraceae bacterium]|nr:type II secretion system F family protein [Lachnospiraceae bacterium]